MDSITENTLKTLEKLLYRHDKEEIEAIIAQKVPSFVGIMDKAKEKENNMKRIQRFLNTYKFIVYLLLFFPLIVAGICAIEKNWIFMVLMLAVFIGFIIYNKSFDSIRDMNIGSWLDFIDEEDIKDINVYLNSLYNIQIIPSKIPLIGNLKQKTIRGFTEDYA